MSRLYQPGKSEALVSSLAQTQQVYHFPNQVLTFYNGYV